MLNIKIMCWCSSHLPQIKKANKNIKVYKLLIKDADRFFAYYYGNFHYNIGITYTLNDKELYVYKNPFVFGGYGYTIHEGFHSFSKNCSIVWDYIFKKLRIYEPKRKYRSSNMNDSFPVSLFIYNHKTGKTKEVSVVITECFIPKGSLYCLNEYGEYVSDKIVIHKIIGSVENVIESHLKEPEEVPFKKLRMLKQE